MILSCCFMAFGFADGNAPSSSDDHGALPPLNLRSGGNRRLAMKKPPPEITPETTVSRRTTLVAGKKLPTSLARNAGAAFPHTLLSEGHLPDAFPRKPCRRTRTLLRLADGLLPGTSSVPRFYVPYFITVKRRCQSFFCPARDFQRDLQENGRQSRKLTTEFTMSFAKDDETEERLLQILYENTVKYCVQKGEQNDTIQ